MKKTFKLIGIALILLGVASCAADDIPLEETSNPTTRALLMGPTEFSNQTVSIDRLITGSEITSTNVSVVGGARLVLQAQVVTISKPFTVEKGSKLEITH